VESRVGAGTTFHIYLAASDGIPEQENIEVGAREQSGRILIMDDEIEVCNVASRILEHLGFEVQTAANGTEAIRLYSAASLNNRPFNAVILDLTVPGDLGGRETLAELKSLDNGVKAIVSSGYSNDPVMSDPERYGFQAVIAKPYRIEDIRGAVSTVLGSQP
jgi:CheY-like chemotaxis protein